MLESLLILYHLNRTQHKPLKANQSGAQMVDPLSRCTLLLESNHLKNAKCRKLSHKEKHEVTKLEYKTK